MLATALIVSLAGGSDKARDLPSCSQEWVLRFSVARTGGCPRQGRFSSGVRGVRARFEAGASRGAVQVLQDLVAAICPENHIENAQAPGPQDLRTGPRARRPRTKGSTEGKADKNPSATRRCASEGSPADRGGDGTLREGGADPEHAPQRRYREGSLRSIWAGKAGLDRSRRGPVRPVVEAERFPGRGGPRRAGARRVVDRSGERAVRRPRTGGRATVLTVGGRCPGARAGRRPKGQGAAVSLRRQAALRRGAARGAR